MLLMLFCTATSPLFNGHDWTDANTYLTMGRGLLHSYVPYRDLFDHKGPLLYFLYAVGALLCPSGFTGIFFLQILSMFCTLSFLYRTALLFLKNTGRALISTFMAPFFLLTSGVYYLPQNLDYGGGSAEEFCIPFFVLSIWIVTKNEKMRGWSKRAMFALGCLMGCVLQIKFNLALFGIGLTAPIFVHLLVCRKWKEAVTRGFSLGAGAVSVLVPYLIYGIMTDSLPQFFYAYITFNQDYATGSGISAVRLVKHMILQAYHSLLGTPIAAVSVLGCCIGLPALKGISLWWKCSIFCGMSALGCAVFLGKVMPYTLLPLLLFAYIGLLALCARFPNRPLPFFGKRAVCFFFCLCLLASICKNKVLFYKPLYCSDTPTCQQQIASLIRSGPYPNPSLLEAGMLNRGFYNELGQVPSVFYFYLPNVTYDQHPEILNSQLSYITQETTDYVILQGDSPRFSLTYLPEEAIQAQLYRAAFAHYRLVSVVPGTGAVSRLYYYLFSRP